jgi:hypothetical protein
VRRPLLSAGLLLGLCIGLATAQAQQLPQAPMGAAPGITLKLTVEQTKLIVETLWAVGCQNVAQLVMCLEAAKLRAEIQSQAAEQLK